MRKITIIGGGQSGLQLALGLLQNNYEITLYSDRTADEIRAGTVTSTQAMFDSSLQAERRLGIDLWAEKCPQIEGMTLQVAGPDGQPVIQWQANLDHPAQSVDQRVKFSEWMNLFEQRGGKLMISKVTPEMLEKMDSDLTIVAAGKGQISQLFEVDHAKLTYDKPQRMLALTCVQGVEPHDIGRVSFNIVPGVGEYFIMPGLTVSGPCYFSVAEGVPGGPLDCWADVKTPQEHLARLKQFLGEFIPWEADRSQHMELTDANATLRGSFAPTIRKPIGRVNGHRVLGMADVVVLNDPITGQGSNNAAKCADIYLQRILAHGDQPFTEAWMQETFDTYWNYAQWVTIWTNAMLQPPPPHILKVLASATSMPAVASRFANGFDNPPSFFPWLMEPAATEAFLSMQ